MWLAKKEQLALTLGVSLVQKVDGTGFSFFLLISQFHLSS